MSKVKPRPRSIWLERDRSRKTGSGGTGSARPLAGKGFVTKLPIKFEIPWIRSCRPLDPCAPILERENKVRPLEKYPRE